MCGSVSKPVLLVGSKDHLPSSCPGTVPCPGVQCSLMRMRWFSSARLSSLAAIISPGWPVAILPLWKLVSCEDLLGEVRPDHVVLFPDLSQCLALGLQLSLDQHRLLGPYSQALQVCAGLMFSPRLHGNCLGRVRDCPRQSHPSPPG